MEDAFPHTTLPDDVNELKRLLVAREDQLAQREQVIAEHQKTIAALTQQRDAFHLEKLRLEVRLAKALKQAYGPRADRLSDPGQLLLDFGGLLDALPIDANDLPVAPDEAESSRRRSSRRLRTRGRRDLSQLDHLPQIEHVYELTDELCQCPICQQRREKIGTAISYTIEYLPGSFVRVKHIQHKYACRHCEQNGDNPNIELAAKTKGSPIDKGLPGPGLLAYVVTAKYADYLPLHRLQHIFARQGFELDRSTMCLWLADVARLVRPLYDRMVQRALQSHVLATDDTEMPLLQPGKAKKARMWIYRGDDTHPYNVFAFTESRKRDGPAAFLKDFRGTLLADAYGGYDGIVLSQELPRAGCWAHARRKFVDCEKAAPQVARVILRLIKSLFALEKRLPASGPDATAEERAAAAEERLRRRQAEAVPLLDTLHTLLIEQKAKLLPKHPLAEAIGYTLNQWRELTLFTTDPAVPIHNNLAEQQMKRIALLRKNSLFVATPRGGETAAILSSLTSTCRRHDINPQAYLTQLLANLPDTPLSRVDDWLPDRWKKTSATPPVPSSPSQP
jgi:transposase